MNGSSVEIEFPILLSDLVVFIKSSDLNLQLIQQQIGCDLNTLSHFFAGAFEVVPDMLPEEVFFLWQILVDTCIDIGTSSQTAAKFAIQVTEILKDEPEIVREYIMLAFGESELGPAPIIARKDLPCGLR